MFGWLTAWLKRNPERRNDSVSFDEEKVTRTMFDGRVETVRWDELEEVQIMTTDEGPFVDDVFWILVGGSRGCVVPSEADGAPALLERLQKLPAFDDTEVIRAMGSTSNARFRVWRRERRASVA